MNEKAIKTTEKEISKVIIVNEDGSQEEVNQALIVDYSNNEGSVSIKMRFHKLDMEDIDNIFAGFGKIINPIKETDKND